MLLAVELPRRRCSGSWWCSSSRSSRPRCRCGCSASGAGGAPRSSPAGSDGRPQCCWRSGLDDWDWGADGFLMRAIAIGIPATMAVAVTLDLLARPGSLAIGERAGLVVAPRPVRAVKTRIAVLRRYRELVQLGPPGGLRAVPLRRRSGRALGGGGRGAPSASARGGRRRLREARADRRDARRPHTDRRLRRAVVAAEPGRARTGRGRPARAGGRARRDRSTRCSPSSTGNRSPPRRSARPTGRGCEPAKPSS